MSIIEIIKFFKSKFKNKEIFKIYKLREELLVLLRNVDGSTSYEDNMYIVTSSKKIMPFTPAVDIDKYEDFLTNEIYSL